MKEFSVEDFLYLISAILFCMAFGNLFTYVVFQKVYIQAIGEGEFITMHLKREPYFGSFKVKQDVKNVIGAELKHRPFR